ncbi:MAG: hypothetical protein AAGJ18_14505 [Bacteroidota bacterium]
MVDLVKNDFAEVFAKLEKINAKTRGSYEILAFGIKGDDAHLIFCKFLPFTKRFYAKNLIKPITDLRHNDQRIQSMAKNFENLYQEHTGKKWPKNTTRLPALMISFFNTCVSEEVEDFAISKELKREIIEAVKFGLLTNKNLLKLNKNKDAWVYTVPGMGNFFYTYHGILQPASYKMYGLATA